MCGILIQNVQTNCKSVSLIKWYRVRISLRVNTTQYHWQLSISFIHTAAWILWVFPSTHMPLLNRLFFQWNSFLQIYKLFKCAPLHAFTLQGVLYYEWYWTAFTLLRVQYVLGYDFRLLRLTDNTAGRVGVFISELISELNRFAGKIDFIYFHTFFAVFQTAGANIGNDVVRFHIIIFIPWYGICFL